MITKVQSKRYAQQPRLEHKPRLTALEKGLLRWSVAEHGDRVLDACVGNGLLLLHLQQSVGCDVCGVSDDMESVRVARSRLSGADVAYAPRGEIPWRDNTFDLVVVNMVVSPPTERAMAEALRALKPGGQLLAGCTAVPAPLRQFMGLFHPDADEDRLKPGARATALNLMRKLGLTKITCQRTDLFNSVCIAWKPLAIPLE